MLIGKLPKNKMLSVSVMAHPSREKFFPYLKERLKPADLFSGEVPFSIDEKSEGVWANARRAWAMFDPDAIYHVVIQDDALVCDDFRKRAEDALYLMCKTIGATNALSFYFGNRGTFHHIAEEGVKRGYCTMGRTPWAVAICLPTDLIPEMLEFCDGMAEPQDDVRIGKFIKSKGLRVFFPMPSLIDHRTGEESLVGDPGRFRKAFKFIDA